MYKCIVLNLGDPVPINLKPRDEFTLLEETTGDASNLIVGEVTAKKTKSETINICWWYFKASPCFANLHSLQQMQFPNRLWHLGEIIPRQFSANRKAVDTISSKQLHTTEQKRMHIQNCTHISAKSRPLNASGDRWLSLLLSRDLGSVIRYILGN